MKMYENLIYDAQHRRIFQVLIRSDYTGEQLHPRHISSRAFCDLAANDDEKSCHHIILFACGRDAEKLNGYKQFVSVFRPVHCV